MNYSRLRCDLKKNVIYLKYFKKCFHFLYLLCKKFVLNIRFFFRRLYSLFFNFSDEWHTILKEKGYAGIIFFIIYLSFLVALSFFLGAIIYLGTTLGLHFIVLHTISVFFIDIFIVALYSFIFGKVLSYYSKENIERLVHTLVAYSFSAYFVGNIFGYLTTPDNFFFISFIASFFAAYYFFQGILSLSKQFNELFSFGMSALFFALLIVSYFFINNLLTLLG